jgi:hypothetical protein
MIVALYSKIPTMDVRILPHSTIVATKDQVSSDLGGEVAVLDLKAGMYYGLEAVGARIWSLIQKPRTVNEIRDIILDEYDVEPERCERDLLMLLQRLADEGLVEVKDEPPT